MRQPWVARIALRYENLTGDLADQPSFILHRDKYIHLARSDLALAILILALDRVFLSALDLIDELLTRCLVTSEEMIRYESFRCLAHPLEQREILELVGAEELEYLERLIVAQILDVVTHVLWHDTDIAGDVVKGPSSLLSSEDGNASSATDEE